MHGPPELRDDQHRRLRPLLAESVPQGDKPGVQLPQRPDEALRLQDAGVRFERLRVIGDGVLYGCGFFGDHFEARGVDRQYLHGLGTRAYGAASSTSRPKRSDSRPVSGSSPIALT